MLNTKNITHTMSHADVERLIDLATSAGSIRATLRMLTTRKFLLTYADGEDATFNTFDELEQAIRTESIARFAADQAKARRTYLERKRAQEAARAHLEA